METFRENRGIICESTLFSGGPEKKNKFFCRGRHVDMGEF